MRNNISTGNIVVVLFFLLFLSLITAPGSVVSSSIVGAENYTEVAAKSSDLRLVGPRVLGGQVLAVSVNGSKPFKVKKVSQGVFAADRSFAAGRFALVVDGEALGFLKTQISSFFAGRDQKISGKIYLLSRNGKVKQAIEFFDAHIKSVELPAVDASGDGTTEHFFTVEIFEGRFEPVVAADLKQKVKPVSKKGQVSGFKFELGSLPSDSITKIDSFTVKQRSDGSHPAKIEVPNLKVTFSAADAQAWEDWYQDFVIKGNCSEEGKITLFSSDGRTKLAVFGLSNICPVSLKKNQATFKFSDIEVKMNMGVSK